MSKYQGKNISFEIYGTSHASEIGIIAKNFPKIIIDYDKLNAFMSRRKPSKDSFSTARSESDQVIFKSGVVDGKLEGDFEAVIKNKDTKSKDYTSLYGKPRPSHADYACYALEKTLDYTGGGRFSARLTAPFCIAGGIAKQYLESRGIRIYAYLSKVGKVNGKSYIDGVSEQQIKDIKGFPCLTNQKKMIRQIERAKKNLDSVGGVCECVVYGMPAGVGDSYFDGLEGQISNLVYSIPAVKGIEFGSGFRLSGMRGSLANDEFYYEGDTVKTYTNNAGGINGGISNGMPITLRVAFRPTPSIYKEQRTVDLVNKCNTTIKIKGRHDSCVAVRAVPVVEGAVALALLDCFMEKEDKKYGLLGEKLKHSYSKEIHNDLGLEYQLYEVEKEDIGKFIKEKKLNGFNVTIPYKKEILNFLDEIDPKAIKIGSVNTVVSSSGKLKGYNTDYYGLEKMLKKANISLENKTVAILGTGGLSLTAQLLAKEQNAKRIYIVSRTGELNYHNVYQKNDIEVVINATPVGMFPKNSEKLLDLDRLNNLQSIVECVYNPLKTNLVLQAEKLKLNVTDGLYMLVAQAIASKCIWQNKTVDDGLIERVYQDIKRRKQNVILVGMPSCGKSTLGKLLSQKLGKTFVDTDQLIIDSTNKTPSEIIVKEGEGAFRDIESQVILETCAKNSLVISTGGGSVLKEQNVTAFKQNGVVVYIKRDLDKLSLENRPISQSKGVEEIYKERAKIYKAVADVVIDNNSSIENALEEMLKAL